MFTTQHETRIEIANTLPTIEQSSLNIETAPYSRPEKIQITSLTAATFFSTLSLTAAAASLTALPIGLIIAGGAIGGIVGPAVTANITMESIENTRARRQKNLNREIERAFFKLKLKQLKTKSEKLLNEANQAETAESLAESTPKDLMPECPANTNLTRWASKFYGELHKTKAVKHRERKEYLQKKKALQELVAKNDGPVQNSVEPVNVSAYGGKSAYLKFKQIAKIAGGAATAFYKTVANTYGGLTAFHIIIGNAAPYILSAEIIAPAAVLGTVGCVVGGWFAHKAMTEEQKDKEADIRHQKEIAELKEEFNNMTQSYDELCAEEQQAQAEGVAMNTLTATPKLTQEFKLSTSQTLPGDSLTMQNSHSSTNDSKPKNEYLSMPSFFAKSSLPSSTDSHQGNINSAASPRTPTSTALINNPQTAKKALAATAQTSSMPTHNNKGTKYTVPKKKTDKKVGKKTQPENTHATKNSVGITF